MVEKKGLAIKWSLDSLRYYLLGREFDLETDPLGPNLDPVHKGPQCQSNTVVPRPAAMAPIWQTQRGSQLPVQVYGQYAAWRGRK